MERKELFKDNLRDSHWLGEVVDVQDPNGKGRCRIKVYGKFDLLETEDIPWATPANNQITGSMSVPNVGDVVAIYFDNGDVYTPVYKNSPRIDSAFKADVLDVTGTPELTTSLVYDTTKGVKIYHTQEDGLIISTGGGVEADPAIRVSNDGKIYLYANDIFIASSFGDESEPAVKGQTLTDLLSDMLNVIKEHTHVNAGPVNPLNVIDLALMQQTIDSIKQES